MEENSLEKIELENGQILEIYDLSKKIATDTWLVCISFKIKIKIDNSLFKNSSLSYNYKTVQKRLGKEIIYQVTHERNFIRNEEKESVFKGLKESFLKTNLKYLSNKEFAEKYVLKKFNNQ